MRSYSGSFGDCPKYVICVDGSFVSVVLIYSTFCQGLNSLISSRCSTTPPCDSHFRNVFLSPHGERMRIRANQNVEIEFLRCLALVLGARTS